MMHALNPYPGELNLKTKKYSTNKNKGQPNKTFNRKKYRSVLQIHDKHSRAGTLSQDLT